MSEETNLVALSNLHLALEGMRLRSRRAQIQRKKDYASLSLEEKQSWDENEWNFVQEDSPRVMLLGPEGSGKTSVCKTLLNWTNRAGRVGSPMYVNLDPSEVSLFFAHPPSFHLGLDLILSALLILRDLTRHQALSLSLLSPTKFPPRLQQTRSVPLFLPVLLQPLRPLSSLSVGGTATPRPPRPVAHACGANSSRTWARSGRTAGGQIGSGRARVCSSIPAESLLIRA